MAPMAPTATASTARGPADYVIEWRRAAGEAARAFCHGAADPRDAAEAALDHLTANAAQVWADVIRFDDEIGPGGAQWDAQLTARLPDGAILTCGIALATDWVRRVVECTSLELEPAPDPAARSAPIKLLEYRLRLGRVVDAACDGEPLPGDGAAGIHSRLRRTPEGRAHSDSCLRVHCALKRLFPACAL